MELLRNSVIHLVQLIIGKIQLILLQLFFNIHYKSNYQLKNKLTRQSFFDVSTNMMTIKSMPITNRKKVKAQLPKHIWNQDIGILVLFVRIAWLMPNRCCKGKFSNAIESFRSYLHGNFSSRLLVIATYILISFSLLFCFYGFVLVFILLLKILLTIFDLSTLTGLQEVLCRKVFVKILSCLLIFSGSCA